MVRVGLACLFISLKSLDACSCLVSRSACQDFNVSNLVFIGTVESIRPSALDLSGISRNGNMAFDSLVRDLAKAGAESELRGLQQRALKLLGDAPDAEKSRIQRATSIPELQTELTWIRTQGTQVRFKVQVVFRHKSDDDDEPGEKSKKQEAEKDDKDDSISQLAVWNEAGNCGIPFEKGETYLVYATDDEETDRLATNMCHRTVRVSDAGEDLSYLYFTQSEKGGSVRLEGFITSDFNQFVRLRSDRFRYSETVKSPLSSVTVELKSAAGSRHTATDSGGRFVFDGLSEGDYFVSALGSGLPDRTHVLSGPTRVHIQKGTCTILPVLILSGASH